MDRGEARWLTHESDTNHTMTDPDERSRPLWQTYELARSWIIRFRRDWVVVTLYRHEQ